MKSKKESERFSWPAIKIYFEAMRNHPKLLWQSTLMPLGAMVLSVFVPYFASTSISAAVTGKGDFWTQFLWLFMSVLVGLFCNRIGFISQINLQAKTLYDLQALAFQTIMNRGLRFHTNNIGGKLVSDVTDFLSAFAALMNAFYGLGSMLTLTIIGGLTIVYVNTWQLGVYLTVAVFVMLFWVYTESTKRYNLRSRRLVAQKAVTAHLSDSIVNSPTVKMFAAEKRELLFNNSLSRTLRDLRSQDWTRAGVSGNWRMAMLLLFLIGLILAVKVLSANGHGDILGTSIFAFTFTLTLVMRLFDFNNLSRQVEEAFLQAKPMIKILSEETEVKDVKGATKLIPKNGAISFKEISFAYQDEVTKQNIFSKLSLEIAPGEHVGLVGPSGGGKTTLTRLLLRFEDIQEGSIEIDGQDIKQVTQASLRDSLGYVPQEPLLFHRSIKENIAYGQPKASMTKIKLAAELANATEFIENLANRYDTIVGERGVKLSGGQRQRIAIARVFLKNSPVLVLDEATSALDSESEAAIQEAMFKLIKDKTALVIAHRLSTIQKMDRILVMKEGKIVEEGDHKSLLAKKGVYAKLWQRQSGGFLQD